MNRFISKISLLVPVGPGLICLFLVALPASAETSRFPAPEGQDVAIPSLIGTLPDGDLRADADGALRIDSELRLFYDYFLTARGEVSEARLKAAVSSEAERRLPEAAARQVIALFDRYLRFIHRATDRLGLMSEQGPERIRSAFRETEKLRLDIFGKAVSEALFGDQLVAEKSALLMQKAQLEAETAEAQELARRAYEDSLTPQERAARAAAMKPLTVAGEVVQRRSEGASDAEIWRLRADAFGSEAADRLAALDRRRANSVTSPD